MFGIIVQQVRAGLLRDVSNIAKIHDDMNLNLPPEQVLLMWLNYHLKEAGVNKTVTDFGNSLAVRHQKVELAVNTGGVYICG